jgi:outer membrane receptor protein involved in Fe transport
MNTIASRISALMGGASLLAMSSVADAVAQTPQQLTAQTNPEPVPEQVLITGSLIRGTAAVGVPVTSLGLQDFQTTGSVKIGDLFRNIPSVVIPTDADAINNGGHKTRLVGINIHGLDNARSPRSLMMIDGVRFPIQGDHLNLTIHPSSRHSRSTVLMSWWTERRPPTVRMQ